MIISSGIPNLAVRMRWITIFLLFVVLHLKAQEGLNRVYTLRPAIGVSGCQIHGDSYDGFDKAGFFTGIAVNAKTKNPRSSFELGFYFSQKGSKHLPNNNDFSYYRLNLNYIDLPVIWRYVVKSGYYFTLGPSVAYLVSYSENRDYIDQTGWYRYNKWELAAVAGLGYTYKKKLSIELRSSNSVFPIRNITAKIYYPNPIARFFNKGYYSNMLTVFVSYHLDLKKRNAGQP
jgi:hypothetical protein